MNSESEKPQSAAAAPDKKPKLTTVTILSMLLGVLLTVVAGGGFLAWRQSEALRAEMLTAKTELTQKSRMLDELKGEFAALSQQLYALREHSVARSTPADRARKAESAAPVLPAVDVVKPEAASAIAVAAPLAAVAAVAAATPRRGRTSGDGQNCEIAGKPAAEQALILKRCVGVMDGLAKAAKPRATR